MLTHCIPYENISDASTNDAVAKVKAEKKTPVQQQPQGEIDTSSKKDKQKKRRFRKNKKKKVSQATSVDT